MPYKRFYVLGDTCETESNECYSEPCNNGGICIDLIGRYECECRSGFEGKHCDVDTDECASNPCVFGYCVDGIDEYECMCEEGFEGTLYNTHTSTDSGGWGISHISGGVPLCSTRVITNLTNISAFCSISFRFFFYQISSFGVSG